LRRLLIFIRFRQIVTAEGAVGPPSEIHPHYSTAVKKMSNTPILEISGHTRVTGKTENNILLRQYYDFVPPPTAAKKGQNRHREK
jgi:hypothetical protein